MHSATHESVAVSADRDRKIPDRAMDQSDYVIRYHALLEESKGNYLYSLFICLYSQLTIGLTNERVHFLMTLKYMIVGEKFLIC